MAKRPTAAMGKQVVMIIIVGGVAKGGGGWGITAGGKIIKIPPRGPLTASIKKISNAIAKGM